MTPEMETYLHNSQPDLITIEANQTEMQTKAAPPSRCFKPQSAVVTQA